MSGSGSRNNEKDNKEGEGSGGWASTFLKVAGTVAATAAVAGSIYGILQQPEADVAPYRVHTILSITLFNEF
ncbi:hypothetical protein TSUD_135090 [Trifolium subterraneum]|uniref:Uncharacterized protein n=1 Tax=Trifolium subterraneum TaxID=3900 RepID=A0A2Z6PGQ1_TRISU|nr:hypothetical protein TSUD_135090 [Trifolium subterraneum]